MHSYLVVGLEVTAALAVAVGFENAATGRRHLNRDQRWPWPKGIGSERDRRDVTASIACRYCSLRSLASTRDSLRSSSSGPNASPHGGTELTTAVPTLVAVFDPICPRGEARLQARLSEGLPAFDAQRQVVAYSHIARTTDRAATRPAGAFLGSPFQTPLAFVALLSLSGGFVARNSAPEWQNGGLSRLFVSRGDRI